MTNKDIPLIQIDDLVRPMTDEEHEAHLSWQAEQTPLEVPE